MKGFYDFDLNVFRAINLGWRSAPMDALMWILSYLGLGQIQFLCTLVLLRWRSTRPYVLPLLATILLSGLLLAQGLKRLFVDRDRPSYLNYSVVQEDFWSKSFPSGHTSTAFAVATMIVLMTTGTRRHWAGPIALVWAVGVGISRIYRGVHWPTDTIGGVCAGAMGSSIIYLVFNHQGWLQLNLDRFVARTRKGWLGRYIHD